MPDRNLPSSYVRFLNLVQAVRGLPLFSGLDPAEEELLGRLAVSWHDEERISVADVMRNVPDTSRSTTYRRLMGLKRKGMVRFETDRWDKRLRLVTPTPLAEDYLRRMSECMHQVACCEGTP